MEKNINFDGFEKYKYEFVKFKVDGEEIEFPYLFFACSDYLFNTLFKSIEKEVIFNSKKDGGFLSSLKDADNEWIKKKYREFLAGNFKSPFFKNISKIYNSFNFPLENMNKGGWRFSKKVDLDNYNERVEFYKSIEKIRKGEYGIKNYREIKTPFVLEYDDFMNQRKKGVMKTGVHGFEFFDVNGTLIPLNYFRVNWDLYNLLVSGEIYEKRYSIRERRALMKKTELIFKKLRYDFITVVNSTSYEIPLNKENVEKLLESIYDNCSFETESCESCTSINKNENENKKEKEIKMEKIKNTIVSEVKELVNTSGAADIAMGRLLYNNIKSALGKTVVKISFVDRAVAKVSKKMKYKNEVTELVAILTALVVLKQFYDHKALENVRGYIVNRLYAIGIEATGFDDVLALINQNSSETKE